MDNGSQPRYEDLLRLAREGCTESQGQLLGRYRKYLKTLARIQIQRSLLAKADASDIVQETFLRAVEEFDQFRGATEQQLIAWLRAILASRLAKFVRRQMTQRRSVQMDPSLYQLDLVRVQIAAKYLTGQAATWGEFASSSTGIVSLADRRGFSRGSLTIDNQWQFCH